MPVFRCLARRPDLDLTVLFAMIPDAAAQGAGFGVAFEWDLPLLEGYPFQVLDNVSRSPGVTHFSGCDTPSIETKLRALRADVVVVNGWVVKSCLQALAACKRIGIPCIVRGEANHLRPRPWWKRFLQRQLVRRYDAVLPIGSANRDFYASCGVADSNMFPAHYCIENDRFSRAAGDARPQRSQIRARWGIPDDAVCYLFCGKFESKKHPVELVETFLRAHRTCQQRHPDARPIHLLMVGDGQLRPQCESIVANDRATRLASQANVTMAGFLNQSAIVDAYVAADCLVMPSDHGETWGLVVNEAFACELPAIVSDQVGCVSDLIVDGQTGFVFRFGDWNGLADLLVGCADPDVSLSKMGARARQLIEAYSPQHAADGIAAAVLATTNGRTLA